MNSEWSWCMFPCSCIAHMKKEDTNHISKYKYEEVSHCPAHGNWKFFEDYRSPIMLDCTPISKLKVSILKMNNGTKH